MMFWVSSSVSTQENIDLSSGETFIQALVTVRAVELIVAARARKNANCTVDPVGMNLRVPMESVLVSVKYTVVAVPFAISHEITGLKSLIEKKSKGVIPRAMLILSLPVLLQYRMGLPGYRT